jgi:hypothetical protein
MVVMSKKTDKYRFSLQWATDTEEKIQAGDFLESLGNRKSEFIIMAVTDYLIRNPEAIFNGRKHKIVVKQNFTIKHIRAILADMLEERSRHFEKTPYLSINPVSESLDNDIDIDEMLNYLDMFEK